MADLYQDINRFYSFIMCLNDNFPSLLSLSSSFKEMSVIMVRKNLCSFFKSVFYFLISSTKNNRSNLMLKLFSKRFIFMTQKCIQNFKCWRPTKNFIRIPIFGNVQIHGVFATFGIPHCVYPMQKNLPESKSTL